MDSNNALSPVLSSPAAAPYAALWYGDLLSAGAATQSWIWQGYLGTGQVTLLDKPMEARQIHFAGGSHGANEGRR